MSTKSGLPDFSCLFLSQFLNRTHRNQLCRVRCVKSLIVPVSLGLESPVALQDASEASTVAEWDGGMGCGLKLL